MEDQKLQIECERCGKTMSEHVTESALCYRFTNQTPVRVAFLVLACAIASSRVSA
jgi:hypothetical protein